ncbi:MAG TPA: FHA domain-containing protein [Schlesneria sp.]
MSQLPTTSTAKYQSRGVGGVARMWLDGVGAFLVCFDNQVRIGGSTGAADVRPEISLMSNLSRHHVRLIRSGEVWLLEPLGPTAVDDRPVFKHCLLNDGNRLRLGLSVKLRFRLPSALTGTARIDFESPHRPNPSVDGIILLAGTCVLGPGLDSHITCRPESDRVMLTQRPSGFWCQASGGVWVDEIASGTEAPCETGKVYSGQNWRFRLESVT